MTGSVCQPKTGVLPTVLRNQPVVFQLLCGQTNRQTDTHLKDRHTSTRRYTNTCFAQQRRRAGNNWRRFLCHRLLSHVTYWCNIRALSSAWVTFLQRRHTSGDCTSRRRLPGGFYPRLASRMTNITADLPQITSPCRQAWRCPYRRRLRCVSCGSNVRFTLWMCVKSTVDDRQHLVRENLTADRTISVVCVTWSNCFSAYSSIRKTRIKRFTGAVS